MSNTPAEGQSSAAPKKSFGKRSKSAFDKGWAAFERMGAPVNRLTNKIGSEAFWPSDLGQESDKAARVLKSFCKDGAYTQELVRTETSPSGKPVSPGPNNKPKVLMKIPPKVIQSCVGLAIFSVVRAGFWISGAGGSGVLIAKKEDGNWGPPSGILVHTLGVGFMAGIDIYDCVIVINNRQALEAFKTMRVSLGGELSVVAGPFGAGGVLESELLKSRKPMFSYVKSRGLYGGLQIDGTVIVERNDENARFYGERLPIADVIAGRIQNIPSQTRLLMEIVKQAEGRTDVDQRMIDQVNDDPAPSDMDLEEPRGQQQNRYSTAPPHYDDAMSVTSSAPSQGHYPPEKTGHATDASDAHEQRPAYPPRPGSIAPSSASYDHIDQPHLDRTLYDPPTPVPGGSSPFPAPLNVSRPGSKDDATGPPAIPMPEGSPPPPPKSEKRDEKRDPDAPPTY
ncbi:uncharacterized protein L3040_008140 [Drepanopeziza brunnea f. sp. 'multigermtubi']|uniref:Ysc84 actin-binding domain-containing protein n=1 Tax=Marssonina brunnea f. sp. multigermtubi (strain MB_m1) TaxID=1072389 RepID=K1WMI0_MARBU|nr:uncharacterized protein MBM_03162 [Drepanopeziza brunnea f. sp. 'multigermtubi' MB_m1]EKD18920.1 hypothetical protein MBM_03162 [Drepanopeziza brunnea f. sp. 'multigermtubi' MB_m1]KAJ5034872.1 hypothetical protein L3040_008140 [Drepanopeziza brunnea f. sp. 'multigermtubi']